MKPKCIYENLTVEKYSLLGRDILPWDDNGQVYYYVQNVTFKLPEARVRQDIDDAFSMWNYYLDEYGLKFVKTLDPALATITLRFAGGQTGVAPDPLYQKFIDDPDILAFVIPGKFDIWINDNIDWQIIDLKTPVAHEIGHVQNIGHTDDTTIDLMYRKWDITNRITSDTVRAMWELYKKRVKIDKSSVTWEIIFGAFIIYLIYKSITT